MSEKTITFTQGTPTTITASVACKLTTRPYESKDYFTSLTLTLNPDADVKKAFTEIFDYLEMQELAPRVKRLRDSVAKARETNAS